ncbi:secretion protein EspD [Mycobacterium hubeiense]|uniref:secretion protein EspD n=1 Tax=Mycobacterium hubeiense TaxID=1867256 RepID=UPI000C7EB3EF|nr:secretion protein EspD [Mycobacterium sp. QGD 101]
MVGESPPHDPDDDEYDDLAALDFTYTDDDPDDNGLDVLAEYAPIAEPEDSDDVTAPVLAEVEDDDAAAVPLFTVTNPPGTVTVTTFMDGRVQQIELSPKVTTMTEADLAEEILVIADLATQDARSAQYAYMLEGMRQQGHDDIATREFLTRDLDLPTPEQAEAARAEVFSTRYVSGHE